jgi:NTE family protein
VLDTLLARKGLNPGMEFLAWISGILHDRGIDTTKDLLDRVQTMAPTITSVGQDITGPPKLKVVAAEVRTETRVDFPRMAPLFWKNCEDLNPSYFVRASMSVPLFFEPLTIEKLPDTPELRKCWKELMWSGAIPATAVFVDGGIMSNFPIDLFHAAERVPSRPTLGVKLGIDRTEPHRISGPHHVVSAAFNAARHTLDTDFILRNPDYSHLLTYIDTGDHGWLNFSLSDADQVDLFRRGAKAAADFVATFDWEEYKELRRDVASAFKRSRAMESLAAKWYERPDREVSAREGGPE